MGYVSRRAKVPLAVRRTARRNWLLFFKQLLTSLGVFS